MILKGKKKKKKGREGDGRRGGRGETTNTPYLVSSIFFVVVV